MKRRAPASAAGAVKPIVLLSAMISFVVSAGVIMLLFTLTSRHTHGTTTSGGSFLTYRDPALSAESISHDHDHTAFTRRTSTDQTNARQDMFAAEAVGPQYVRKETRASVQSSEAPIISHDASVTRQVSQPTPQVVVPVHPFLQRGDSALPHTPLPRCFMWGTWSEACYYENVCFDAKGRYHTVCFMNVILSQVSCVQRVIC